MLQKKVWILSVVLLLTFSFGAMAKDITLGYVEWDCAISQTHILAVALEERFGLTVELISVDAGIMWTGLAQGDLDVIVAAWLPSTHSFYFEEYKEDLVLLGPNFHGARIGLVVPTYMNISTIAELKDHARDLRSMIYGIDPGAGLMAATEKVLELYALDFHLLDSSDAAMTIQLGQAVRREEPIVVTGWVPHWKFDAYPLTFLDDPLDVYGGEETINTVVRTGFLEEFPADVVSFIQNFYLTQGELHEMMNMVREASELSELELARIWVEENAATVDKWSK